MIRLRHSLTLLTAALLAACASPPAPLPPPPVETPIVMVPLPPKIGLALGGGAARGFAHVGVIKMLESQGIVPDLIVGTSAGSVVGALYAAGINGFALQEMTFDLDRAAFADWQFFGRGLLRGEALQKFVNDKVGNKRIEQLPRPFGAVSAKLRSGDGVLFQRGDVGMAVRASSAIPGIFVSPVINGEEYIDGGAVSPVPVNYARQMGAEVVIAVDISQPVSEELSDTTLRTVLKTFSIMGNALKTKELPLADVVIAPNVKGIAAADFESKQKAILEGERAAFTALTRIREAIAAKTRMVPAGGTPVAHPTPSSPPG